MEHVPSDFRFGPSVNSANWIRSRQIWHPALHSAIQPTTSPHQMGAEISQVVKSDLETSTLEELLSNEKVSLMDFEDMNSI
jgi:hypothetical protein